MKESFIARQPILNPQGDVFGYELLFRSNQQTQQAKFQDEMEATTSILSNMLTNFGQDWLLGGTVAFINTAENTLQSDFIDLLNPSKTIFEITPMTLVKPALIEKVQELKSRGFRFLLDDCARFPDKRHLYAYCDYFKIDCQRTGMLGLLNEITEYSNVTKYPQCKNIKFIATKIESEAEKNQAIEMGCALLQGYYFEKPQLLVTKNLSPNAAALLKILHLTRKEADIVLIEDALKKDVSSSLKLLRYINSAGFGFRHEITSFKQAVQILGYQQLTRWVLLLLATSNAQTPPALAKAAISRGRFMEMIAQHKKLSSDESDNLFLTGTFSFLDALLGVDMDSVLPSLGLNEKVNQALMNSDGPYYPYLLLAIASERGMTEMQALQADKLGLHPEQINQALLEATSWSENFVRFK